MKRVMQDSPFLYEKIMIQQLAMHREEKRREKISQQIVTGAFCLGNALRQLCHYVRGRIAMDSAVSRGTGTF